MNYLSALRDQLNIYGYFSNGGQSGGGNDDDDSETDEDYHHTYVSEGLNQTDNLIKSTDNILLKNKSDYYDFAITQSPKPLDQNILLTTIIEEDLKQIAKLLIESMNMNFEETDSNFNSCVLSMCKKNKDKIQVSSEELEEYTNNLNEEGSKCLDNCRVALNNFNSLTKNKNINDCLKMINGIFITYVWSQYNSRNEETKNNVTDK
jgi:hypothetical protein